MLDQPEQQAGSILHSQRTHQDDAPARTPAPSEVFGPFGPPGWSPGEEIPRSNQSPAQMPDVSEQPTQPPIHHAPLLPDPRPIIFPTLDRKSTRLNSSHVKISYAVFCLKK